MYINIYNGTVFYVGRLVIGSYKATNKNELQIISQRKSGFIQDYSVDHLLPATKVTWIPDFVSIHTKFLYKIVICCNTI